MRSRCASGDGISSFSEPPERRRHTATGTIPWASLARADGPSEGLDRSISMKHHQDAMPSYRIQVCSDVDYTYLIAEVYIGERFVALVSREDPTRDFTVEFPGPEQHQPAI